MGFKAEVDKVLPGACEDGLQALEKKDRGRVNCKDPRRLAGSVNLDEALKRVDPNGNRWDYGIGVRRKGGKEEVFWVEVHPASTSDVGKVLTKLEWLDDWLSKKAPALRKLTAKNGYVWIASGEVDIRLLKGSSRGRLLAEAGLEFPRQRLRIE
jgi:hypothetical protein